MTTQISDPVREARFHDFTLDEAVAIAKRNDPGEKVPSVSRTLLARIATLEAERNGERMAHESTKRALAEATETWTDEDGTTWRPPTAWAYAQVCRVLAAERARVAGCYSAVIEELAVIAKLGEPEAARRRLGEAFPIELLNRESVIRVMLKLKDRVAALADAARKEGKDA
jgi:hypothetical protein